MLHERVIDMLIFKMTSILHSTRSLITEVRNRVHPKHVSRS